MNSEWRLTMEITSEQRRTLKINIISHIRKNHAMEHATIHMLAKMLPKVSFSGYSIHKGFWIIGKAELQDVHKAAEMALAKLRNGDSNLAIHPNCGTNLAVTGLCVAGAALLTTHGLKDDDPLSSKFSAFVTAGMAGVLASRPLGPRVQQWITTDPDVQKLSIDSINLSQLRGPPAFFVKTRLDD